MSRKVASELTVLSNGGFVSDSTVEFSNEWWNFRYNLKNSNILKMVGPSNVKNLYENKDNQKSIIFGNEMRNNHAITFPINNYFDDSEELTNKEIHWSLLVFFPALYLFIYFDSKEGSPNLPIAQNLASIISNNVYLNEGINIRTVMNCNTPKERIKQDSGLYTIAITACLAKYLGETLKEWNGTQYLIDSLVKLIMTNITEDYIVYLRSYLKSLHSKLHHKIYEIVTQKNVTNYNDSDRNPSHKRKIETGSPNIARRRIGECTIIDLEIVERNMNDVKIC